MGIELNATSGSPAGLIVGWLALGAAGLIRPHHLRFRGAGALPAGGPGRARGRLGRACRRSAPGTPQTRCSSRLGLPDLPFHLRLDALSGFFLLLLGVAAAGITIFAAGYFRAGEGTAPGLLCLQYHVFLASMALVLVADDAYFFMVAWETMALSSYFLVTTQHRIPEIRRAGFLYLLIAHVGAISILLCFGVLQGGSWQFTFDAMRGPTLHLPGPPSPSSWPWSASGPRPAWSRCTSGCPRRIPPRPRRSRR